jgi:D-amino peptidase
MILMKRALGAPVAALSLVLALALAGCQSGQSSEDATETAAGPPQSAEPWTVTDARTDATDGIRVLVLHDMEGLSGQNDWRSFSFSQPQYARGQEMLVADVNAVIDGLFAGGATEVHVVDGHGSGNPEPDVRADLLDQRATQVFRDEAFDTYFDLVEPGAYDAVAVVGMHAKTGSGGFASHTYTLGIEFQINGQAITETELVGLSWGRADVPVIFASGDDRLANDLETMPWIEFVTVKRATSASTVELRPVDEARADLRDGARRAVENLASAKVMKVNTPIVATLLAVPPASLELMEGFPGIDYADNSVTFVADDLADAYDGLVAIVGVARQSYSGVLMEQLRRLPEGSEVFANYRVDIMERWLDVESGRWAAPDRATANNADRRYHGYQ